MKFGILRTTISRVYHEYQISGKTSNLLQQSGQKRTFTEWDHRRLKKIVAPDRRSSLRQIAATYLIDFGFRSCRPCRVLLWTQRYKALRLSWALPHCQTLNNCKNVVWSDETHFQLYWTDGRVRVCTKPYGSLISTRNCSSWWRFCDGMGSVQLTWNRAVDTFRLDHDSSLAEIVEVEIEVVSPSIVPSGSFAELKSHCHLYGAQGQRQAYLLPMTR
ncbi:HTH_Tnp_Tc3_2 domain-containing protein [Trichonephila clavipes]|nr:HTH_Tnp_Tc3_2 domain-containing protein [Trichonephila clavipes]